MFLGLLPPPVDGQRLITRMMLERITRLAPVAVYDLQPRSGRLGALAKPLRMLGAILFLGMKRLSGSTSLYLAPPSGRGMQLAGAVALVARLLGFRIFVHYHSWKLVATASRATAAFVWSCGAEAWHITLAPPMAEALHRNYGRVKRAVALSNSAF
ncbi:MAG: hypothetical protein JO255_21560, partial [Alphaproteobacteria bacterium]|nr:hypothetical protein [Alphaproteobacteria bacterium]